jgi:hypothetical protein
MNRLRPPSGAVALEDAVLDDALRDLGRALDAPTADGLAGAVRARIESAGYPPPLATATWPQRLVRRLGWGDRGRPSRHHRPVERALLVAVLLVLVAAGLAAAIGFGLPGLRLVFEAPTLAPNPSGSSSGASAPASLSVLPSRTPSPLEALALGVAVEPARLDATVGFHMPVPAADLTGPPSAAYADTTDGRDQASLVFAGSAGERAAPGAPAIVVTAFAGRIEGDYLQKVIGPGTSVTSIAVVGRPGFWISGQPHDLLYVAPDGSVETDRIRIVGNVLAWNAASLTIRIEGARDLAAALRIADSMR